MLPDGPALLVFLAASAIVLVVPGPAVAYIVARSIDRGPMAGVISTLGVGVGSMVHVVAAAAGLSALLVSSAWAFGFVKFAGAAYLIYLGVKRLMERGARAPVEVPGALPLTRMFGEAVLVNVLNPKTALFYFAFLPQFADPARGSIALQICLLGVIYVVMGILSDGAYAPVAGHTRALLAGMGRWVSVQRLAVGGTFVGLGVLTAMTDMRR